MRTRRNGPHYVDRQLLAHSWEQVMKLPSLPCAGYFSSWKRTPVSNASSEMKYAACRLVITLMGAGAVNFPFLNAVIKVGSNSSLPCGFATGKAIPAFRRPYVSTLLFRTYSVRQLAMKSYPCPSRSVVGPALSRRRTLHSSGNPYHHF